jgi:hypothetical protein
MYRGMNVTYPIQVKLVAMVKPRPDDAAERVISKTVELRHGNDQVTAFRFRLDKDGHVVDGSVNTLYKELRVASQ